MTGDRKAARGRPERAGDGAGPAVTLAAELTTDQYPAHTGREVHVFLEVTAVGLRAVPAAAARSEVVIIDCSGSMAHPTFRRIAAARRAAEAAVAMLPDGTRFALIEGNETARVAYPWRAGDAPATVAASARTRAEGRATARAMNAYGGTRISSWLALARRLLADCPERSFRHALLLTDGRDEHEAVDELRRVLDACAGEFTCDALGVGEDWDARQLLEITGRLHGRAEAVADAPAPPEDAAEDPLREQLTGLFRHLVGTATARTLPRLDIRVRTAGYLRISGFRQLSPHEVELTGAAAPPGAAGTGAAGADGTGADGAVFPTGAWGDETRWFELRLRADPRHPGYLADLAAGRPVPIGTVTAEPAAPVAAPEPVPLRVRWTDEPPPPSGPADRLGFLLLQNDMTAAIGQGCEALLRSDPAAALRELGPAVRLAHELGDAERLAQLGRLVVIDDAAAGRVRPRPDPGASLVHHLLVASSHRRPPPGRGSDGGAAVRCPAPECGAPVPPGRYCEVCGTALPPVR